jgi:hypothetical protein
MLEQTDSTYRASRSGFDFLGVMSGIAAVTSVEASGVERCGQVLQSVSGQRGDIW